MSDCAQHRAWTQRSARERLASGWQCTAARTNLTQLMAGGLRRGASAWSEPAGRAAAATGASRTRPPSSPGRTRPPPAPDQRPPAGPAPSPAPTPCNGVDLSGPFGSQRRLHQGINCAQHEGLRVGGLPAGTSVAAGSAAGGGQPRQTDTARCRTINCKVHLMLKHLMLKHKQGHQLAVTPPKGCAHLPKQPASGRRGCFRGCLRPLRLRRCGGGVNITVQL